MSFPPRSVPRRPPGAALREAGFTLIELLAVLLIFGLLAGIALPNLGVKTGRVLEDEARRLAADLEFVRQRAVLTGVPHRVVFDLDEMAWRIEWYATEAEELGETHEQEPAAPLPAAGSELLALSAPRGEAASFRRPQGPLGDLHRLDSAILIDGIETPAGYIDSGELELVFADDGSSDSTLVVLADDSGRAITLELEPLADTVRFERGHL